MIQADRPNVDAVGGAAAGANGLFLRLQQATIHPLLACNIACGYCYQDAERTGGAVVPRKSGREWASWVASVFSRSQDRDIDIVVTGGEPLLMGFEWYREFLDATAAALVAQGKRVGFTIQTNASLALSDGMTRLLQHHGVRFSVHYDGLIDGDELKSRTRHDVMESLAKAGFPLTAIIVGTPPALERLPETLDFFHRIGVSHYRLNAVGGEGRGRMEHNPTPRQRAVAEFLTGFHAWQNGFKPYESGLIWKFVSWCRAELSGQPRPQSVSPQPCGGGDTSITIYPDGSIYPCGFYCELSGRFFNVDELAKLEVGAAARLRDACGERSAVFEERCQACEALIYCGAYCAMSAKRDNNDVLCKAQLELLAIMRDNPSVTTAIANAFLMFREANGAPKRENLQ